MNAQYLAVLCVCSMKNNISLNKWQKILIKFRGCLRNVDLAINNFQHQVHKLEFSGFYFI